jgi:hypothetical protein
MTGGMLSNQTFIIQRLWIRETAFYEGCHSIK